MKNNKISIILFSIFSICSITMADDFIVHPDGGGQYSSIQHAVNAANSGDAIILTKGVYSGTGNTNITIQGKSLKFIGLSNAEETIIDCRRRGSVFIISSDVSSLRIENITFTGARSGAISTNGFRTYLRIQDCHFNDNSNTENGGAIGGQLRTLRVYGTGFTDNRSSKDGGAIYLREAPTSSVIFDCSFKRNRSYDDGGAVYNHRSSLRILRSKFYSNNSSDNGGAIYTSGSRAHSSISDSVFISNRSSGHGGAIAFRNDCTGLLSNVTATENRSRLGASIYCENQRFVRVYRSIFWGSINKEIHTSRNGEFSVSISNIQGGYPGTNNIDLDPLFTTNGYSLSANSPCIDRTAPINPDLDGEIAFDHPSITNGEGLTGDLGADEFVDNDGDNIADSHEFFPNEEAIAWPIVNTTSYSVTRVGLTAVIGDPIDVSNSGRILFAEKTWKSGQGFTQIIFPSTHPGTNEPSENFNIKGMNNRDQIFGEAMNDNYYETALFWPNYNQSPVALSFNNDYSSSIIDLNDGVPGIGARALGIGGPGDNYVSWNPYVTGTPTDSALGFENHITDMDNWANLLGYDENGKLIVWKSFDDLVVSPTPEIISYNPDHTGVEVKLIGPDTPSNHHSLCVVGGGGFGIETKGLLWGRTGDPENLWVDDPVELGLENLIGVSRDGVILGRKLVWFNGTKHSLDSLTRGTYSDIDAIGISNNGHIVAEANSYGSRYIVLLTPKNF